jgi:DNA-binding MarR family transcriptional regulator
MDFLRNLGPLAMASRLKRLTDRLYRSGERIYADQGAAFEPRWFTIVARLAAAQDAVPITTISRDLGVSHPAVIKLVRELENAGLVCSNSDPADGRRRLIRLTAGGDRLVADVRPIWAAFEHATRELYAEIGYDLITVIDRLEEALERQDLSARVTAHIDTAEDIE